MRLHEYATHDATALADLVARGAVSPRELAALAAEAIAVANPQLGAVVETYADRIDGLDEATLGPGPFRGVPLLMKDVFGHEAGRRIEFGSRLCRGMVATEDTAVCRLLKQAGFNLLGRSAAPEYSMAGTTETALYGNTSTPWRAGYSAGGSSGGAASAVAAGLVPLAHGSDIAGSIRIPASFCGGVGLKPSRGRVSFAPMLDENGYGLGQNFVQTRSLRDTAALLDVLAEPQVGDPFAIPRPAGTWLQSMAAPLPRLRVAFSTAALMGVEPDPEVAEAVRAAARWLQGLGHAVHEFTPACDLRQAQRHMLDLWFFGFPERLAGYSQRSGHPVDEHHLEPVVQTVLAHARGLQAPAVMAAFAGLNRARRQLATVWTQCDLWITPSTPRVAEPWGRYHLGRTGLGIEDLVDTLYAPTTQYTLPHNVMGTPALSLPLALNSQGLPIGVQFAAPPAHEARLLQVGALFEAAQPWSGRVPPLHVTRLAAGGA